jgi:thiol-disulfide isomerase/thioredoxin
VRRIPATAAIALVALLAGMAGLIVSIRVSGSAGALLATPLGRWLSERVAPASAPPGVNAANEGEVIGPLVLTGLDGSKQRLISMPGRRILVNVWATWCLPCRDEMPILAGFAKENGSGTVVGITEDDATLVRAYLRQTPANYSILLDDPEGRAAVRLGNRLGALPFTALIDTDGRLLRRQYGPFTSATALRQWVAAP